MGRITTNTKSVIEEEKRKLKARRCLKCHKQFKPGHRLNYICVSCSVKNNKIQTQMYTS